MIRTISVVVLLLIAVVAIPLWAQIVVFIVALLTIPYKLALFIPAVFADVVYAPTKTLALQNSTMTIFVALTLLIYWLVMTQTRVAHVYGLETK